MEESERLALLDNMPDGITLQATFEMFMTTQRDGIDVRPDDYSTFFEGPGDYFTSEAKKAKELGMKLYAMTNTGGLTWDFGVVPYEPGPYQWLKRYRKMREYLRGWYQVKDRFVENEYGTKFSLDSYGAKWLAFNMK